MGILVTEGVGFLLTATMGFLFTVTFGIQLTVSMDSDRSALGPKNEVLARKPRG